MTRRHNSKNTQANMLLSSIVIFLSLFISRAVCNTEQISFTYTPSTFQTTPQFSDAILKRDHNRHIQAFAANTSGSHTYLVHAGAGETLNARVCWPASFPLRFDLTYANGVITVHYAPDFFTHKDTLAFAELWRYEIILERPPLSGFFPGFFTQLAVVLPAAVVASGYLVKFF